MNDFRLTLPRSPLINAQRDDISRRSETAGEARPDRMSFDATLQRAATREQASARPDDANGTRPTAPPPAMPPARESSANATRAPASPPTPSAQAARTMAPDDSPRAPRAPADADAEASADTFVDGPADATAIDTASADEDTAAPLSDPALGGSTGLPPAELPRTADATPGAASEANVTAGLIAASMAISSAAARATATSQTVTDHAGSDDPMLEDAEIRGSAGKPASPAVGTPSDADADAARPHALPELSAELTRTTARDRLTQDFEQRFENSLARAVGAPNGGTASGASPLLLAGLPPQPMPAQAATPVAHASITSPLSHPAFGDDLAHRVLLFAGQRVQSAEISLTPGDLGPIRVSLELRGQEASVQFNAAHAATRSAIEDALPRLREMLAAQGLQLAQADVGDRAPRDPQGGRGGDGARPQPGLADARAAALSAHGDASAAGAISGRRVGLIDVRV
jgi:flagellar hook-length control protein FliK